MACVHNLLAHLLGEGELHGLAVWGSKTRDTLVNRLRDNLDLWNSDTLLLMVSQVFSKVISTVLPVVSLFLGW